MRTIITVCIAVLLATPSTYAAGGSSKEETSGADRLAEADRLYNKGIKHRDKAWGYEKKAASAQKSEDREVYTKSAEREFKRAIDAFKDATKKNSRHYEAFGSLGYAQRKVGKFGDSLKSYNRALKMKPDYAEALEYRAETYLGLDRVDDAKKDYAALVKLDKDQARTFLIAAGSWGSAKGDEQVDFLAWVKSEQDRLGPGESRFW